MNKPTRNWFRHMAILLNSWERQFNIKFTNDQATSYMLNMRDLSAEQVAKAGLRGRFMRHLPTPQTAKNLALTDWRLRKGCKA